ncbi:unnamed protein product [Pleuronectes platessa]|uniref:Uncharacterized protein n=1 Tax=Pleuronectes platessa TaxID=8262 RepID=A0A9N7TS67_PLEPL|nr:unnamed protein product [Pleuronectes platessa]
MLKFLPELAGNSKPHKGAFRRGGRRFTLVGGGGVFTHGGGRNLKYDGEQNRRKVVARLTGSKLEVFLSPVGRGRGGGGGHHEFTRTTQEKE